MKTEFSIADGISHKIDNNINYELNELLKNYESRTNIIVNRLEGTICDDLPDIIKEILMQVVKEALINIERYAEATEVTLSLNTSDQQLQLGIQDNGKGFDTTKRSVNAGIGLKTIKDDIDQIGGRFNINSSPGKGTLIKAIIPLNPS
jgi:two-component system NarL family sensor kinase